MKLHGVSLHYYDSEANHDKFYRAFVWYSPDKGWQVTCHWGRDGAPRGQVQTSSWHELSQADLFLRKKVDEKIRKGYEFLGQGEIEVSDWFQTALTDTMLARLGSKLHERVGRTPTKLHSGFSLIIREEDYIEDLI